MGLNLLMDFRNFSLTALPLQIPASHLSGNLTAGQSMQVIRDLNSREPQLKLLYVTPEKIGCSNQLRECFNSLYNRNLLNRWVH